jgi:cell division protein FtsZ
MDEDLTEEDAYKMADDVLHNAVSGIAEIINVPGLVNVDFADVRTVMSEQGKAMMGIGEAAGLDRARIAAEQAVASPLLDGVDLTGARGVIVNITASRSLKLRETQTVVNTIRAFTADDATIIHGTVRNEEMGDNLRVTVIATGLGRVAKRPQLVPQPMLKTGTDNAASMSSIFNQAQANAAGFAAGSSTVNTDIPAIWRNPRAQDQVAALEQSGTDRYDIPAFLRKQAD